jgi:hypothetical protein
MTSDPATRSLPPPVRRRRASRVVALVVGLVVVASGCGTAVPSGTSAPDGTPSRSTPPSGAPVGSDSGSGRPGPRTTPWPGNAVIGVEALGVSDGEIRQAINDFSLGVTNQDLPLMRRAADGLAGIDVLVANAERMEVFPPMQPLAAGLREVLPRIADAAGRLRDAIDAGDAPAIASSSRDLAGALADYAELQAELAGWVVQVPQQKRILVR